MQRRDSRTTGWQVAVVFVITTAVLSQCLEWLRAGLGISADVVAMAQYGPALAAVVTWLVFRQRMRHVMPAAVRSRQVRAHAVIAVAACVVFGILLWVGYTAIGGQPAHGIREVSGVPFILIAVAWLFGATAEEIGWRGVLQPALEVGLPRWGAGIVTGLLWSVWHLPVVALGGAIAVTFILSTTVLSVLMAYLGNGSPVQRVVVTSIVHWLVNLAILVVTGVDVDLAGLVPELIAISITTGAALTVFAEVTRRRSRSPATAGTVA